MEANGGAAKPARGTARLGAEDHSVLVADGEGAAAAPPRGRGSLCLLPPRSASPRLPDPRGGVEGAGRGAALEPELPRQGHSGQEGGKGAERGGGARGMAFGPAAGRGRREAGGGGAAIASAAAM